MLLLNVRCCASCLLIIALTGLLQIINAESFRPIFNPNVALKPTAQKLTAISTTTTTTTTTVRPLTTISATLKSRVSLTKQQAPKPLSAAPAATGARTPVKPLSAPVSPQQTPAFVNTGSPEPKDAPVAEALRGDWRRRYRRPYYPYHPSSNLLPNPRYRRRPNPKPYYMPPPSYNYNNAPYEDYRFETDFLDPNQYAPKPKPKVPPTLDAGKDYPVVDTDIGTFYDPQSATYNVQPLKNYDTQSSYYSGTGSGGTGLSATLNTGYSTGLGSSFGTGLGTGSGSGAGTGSSYGTSGKGGIGSAGGGGLYSDYGDSDDYKYTTSKPKTRYKAPTRPPAKPTKTRTKYSYEDYQYSGDPYASASPEIEEVTPDPNTVAKYNNIYLPPPRPVHQTGQHKSKSKPKPKTTTTTTTTTYAPPIKIGGSSIDVLTKPLGSATFNLNLSPGTVYSPPSFNYNPPGTNYNPAGPSYNSPSYKSIQPIQPIPLQPPATSYGVPIAPPLNAFTYQNSYQNQYNGYQPSIAQNSPNYVDPSQISLTNNIAPPPAPGEFGEPPPLNQQSLSNIDVNYNSGQSSYDATPKATRPTKRKQSKVNSKRVSTKRPALNLDEELADDEQDDQNSNFYGESYSFYKTMPQPSLPNTYDQEEFHTVKNKRKQAKQSSSYYYERDEKVRTTKRPKQPVEVTLRIPDEDYLDDLVKVVQTTKRPKKKSKATGSHVLDTEDLRDAYENNAAYYAKKKNKSTRYSTPSTSEYDDNYEDDSDEDDYENDRLSNINSKEETKSTDKEKDSDSDIDTDSNADGAQETSYWDKNSSIYKQYGIRARNDNFAIGGSYEVQNYNNGFRPIRNDYSKVYAASPSNVRATYVRDIGAAIQSTYLNANRISSTLRSITTTTPKPSTLYLWTGGELPKNHKMV